MTADPWAEARAALDRLAAAGRTATFWLRDDDAVAPTPALDRLLALAARHGAPLALAVIPKDAEPSLAWRLKGLRGVRVLQHGWSHANHAPEGEKPCELGAHRHRELVLNDLAHGRARLRTLFAQRFLPILVPPWNRIAPDLLPRLPGMGFRAVSAFGPERGDSAVPMVNTHVDLIDWRGTRGGRPAAHLAADIAARLGEAAGTGGAVGILSHHLVLDDAAWDALEAIGRLVAAHPAARWADVKALLPAG